MAAFGCACAVSSLSSRSVPLLSHHRRSNFTTYQSTHLDSSIMSTNNHNADTELNDVNLGALAISDDGNNSNDDEGGNDIDAAELLGVPDDHPMVSVFSQMGLKKEVVLFGGVQAAGKIRCTSKEAWKMFGGNANWPEIVAVYSPHLVKPLDLESNDGTTSLRLLRNLLAVDSRPAIRHQSVEWSVLQDGSIRPRLDLTQFVFEVKMTLGTKPFAFAFDSAKLEYVEDLELNGRGIRFPLGLDDATGIRSEYDKAASRETDVLTVDKINGSTTIINKRTMKKICINRVQKLFSRPCGYITERVRGYVEEGTSVQPTFDPCSVIGTVTTSPVWTGLDPFPIKSQFVIHTPSKLSTENAGFIEVLFRPIKNISIVLDNLNWD